MSDIETSRELLTEAIRMRDAQQFNEAAIAFAKLVKQFENSVDPAVRQNVAEALLNLGVLLRALGGLEMAVNVLDRVITGYSAATVFFISSLYNKGTTLLELGQLDAAMNSYEVTLRQADAYRGSEPVVADCVSGALLNLGVIHAQSGSAQRAVDALDDLVRRFANQPELKLQNSVAQALYNKAVVLRDSGNGPQAIAAYTDVVERFSNAPQPELQHWAGMAQYNKAIHFSRLGQVQDSVAASEEMVRLFGSSTDPAIRLRLAKVLYSRAMLARAAGLVTESVQACWDIQARFKDDADPGIQAVVAAARRWDRLLLALANPAFNAATETVELDPNIRLALQEFPELKDKVAGVMNVIWDGEKQAATGPPQLTLKEVCEFLDTQDPEPPPDADRDTQDFFTRRKMLRGELRRDLEGHVRCGEILTAYLDRGEPFGLFLRNFDIEGYLKPGSGAPEPIRVSLQFPDKGLLEKRIGDSLATKVPFVGVGNNAPLRPDFKSQVPRMQLGNEHWQEVVEELISAASIIVMDVVRLTPGVHWELSTVQRLGRQEQTVVVLSTPRAQESIGEVATYLYRVGSADAPVASADNVELKSFKRLVREADLPEGLAHVPCFADLLAQIEQVQKTDPAARPSWDGVVF
jgi:tetratricopeptide (TPR) repeat protein